METSVSSEAEDLVAYVARRLPFVLADCRTIAQTALVLADALLYVEDELEALLVSEYSQGGALAAAKKLDRRINEVIKKMGGE